MNAGTNLAALARTSIKGIMMAALGALIASAPARAATYVYVSNADDGEITTYAMQANGTLVPGPKVEVAKVVMPMAVSPDKRFLYAVTRSKPFSVHAYAIDP